LYEFNYLGIFIDYYEIIIDFYLRITLFLVENYFLSEY